MKPHTEEKRAAVVAAYADGMVVREIATRFKVSIQSVYTWAKDAGVEIKRKRGRRRGA